MNDYRQPNFYRFNSDSIELAKHVIKDCENRQFELCGDFFSGCGVISIELIQAGLKVDEIIFIEKNKKFIPFIEENLQLFVSSKFPLLNTVIENKDVKESQIRFYDLIVANPPYFYKSKAKLPPNIDKASARFFTDFTFLDIVKLLSSRLKFKGIAYVLYRADQILEERVYIEEYLSKNKFKWSLRDSFFKEVGLLTIFGCNEDFCK